MGQIMNDEKCCDGRGYKEILSNLQYVRSTRETTVWSWPFGGTKRVIKRKVKMMLEIHLHFYLQVSLSRTASLAVRTVNTGKRWRRRKTWRWCKANRSHYWWAVQYYEKIWRDKDKERKRRKGKAALVTMSSRQQLWLLWKISIIPRSEI